MTKFTGDAIDALAYTFWAIHPSKLDAWYAKPDTPRMPDGYAGGVRAWFFACHMRAVVAEQKADMANLLATFVALRCVWTDPHNDALCARARTAMKLAQPSASMSINERLSLHRAGLHDQT